MHSLFPFLAAKCKGVNFFTERSLFLNNFKKFITFKNSGAIGFGLPYYDLYFSNKLSIYKIF